jgi:hypothetical protein
MNLKQVPWVAGIAAVAVLIGHGASPPEPARETAQPAAAIVHGGTAPKEGGKSGATAAQADARQASRRRYASLYREFLGIEAPTPPSRAAPAARLRGTLAAQPLRIDLWSQPEERLVGDQDLREIAQAARAYGYGPLEFMIVLVADPIDSGLASDFDLAMIAVQRALADAGYRHDRQWLPWIDPQAAEEKAFRETAGMMLFRRPPDHRQPASDRKRRLLAVFLVGETPKLGIHKQAFREAIDFILDLHRAEGWAPREASPASPRARRARARAAPPLPLLPEIPLLGPTFSGSSESLRIALREAMGRQDVSFRIVSGSASEPGLERRLRDGGLAWNVQFSRTVIADDELAERGLLFLQDRLGWNLNRAAMLVERDTAYGSYLAREQRQPLLAAITKLPFPSGLFALRNAWEQMSPGAPRPAAEAAGGPQAPAAPRTTLDVSLADQRTPVDVVPELTPVTARIADMGVANLLRQVSREGFRYVGILATDIKDQLFLAEQVRRWAPDVILFVVDNNLLYVHPQYNATMFGTITISSYPLTPEPAPFSPPAADLAGNFRQQPFVDGQVRLRQQFFSERQEGIYYAARSFICDVRPPEVVWISASGNYGIWPLAKVPVSRAQAGAANRSENTGPPVPRAWLGPWQGGETIEPAHPAPDAPPAGTYWILVLLLAGLCLASWMLRHWVLGFSRAVDRPRTRLLMVAAAGLPALAGAGILGFWIACLGASDAGWTRWFRASDIGWNAWRGLLGMLLAYGVLLGLFVEAAGPGPPVRAHRKFGRFVMSVVIGLLLLGPMLFLLWLWQQGDIRHLLFRAGALAGGMSPLVSLAWVAVAVFYWMSVELERQLIRERDRTGWPLDDGREAPLAGARDDAALLDRLVERDVRLLAFWLAVSVVLVPVCFLLTNIQPIGESRRYGIAFLVAAAAIGVLVLVPFFRLARAWFVVRRLLHRVAHTSLVEVLPTVRGEVDWTPQHLSWDVTTLAGLRRAVERLRELIQQSPLRRLELHALLARISSLAHRKDPRVSPRARQWRQELFLRQRLETRFQQAYALLRDVDHPAVGQLFAVRLIVYFQQVFIQLRYWLMASMGTGLLLIAGVATYAFQPKRFTMLVAWGILSAVSAATVAIFVQMSRDATLSAIGGTVPGKVTYDWHFVSNVLAYGVVPVLGLVASQFPSIGRWLNSLLEPLARLLRVN